MKSIVKNSSLCPLKTYITISCWAVSCLALFLISPAVVVGQDASPTEATQEKPATTDSAAPSSAGKAAPTQTTEQSETAEQDAAESKTKPSSEDRFVRIKKNEQGEPVAMETSTITYTRKMDDGTVLEVDLVGVVHIGEKDYYKEFNEQFKAYDSLLYELVAPKGTKIDKRDDSGLNPVAALQKGMMSMLGLQFQLDHIDYNATNFVHADMSPEEFAESMSKNNESVMKILFRTIGMSAAMSNQGNDTEMLRALMASGKERIFRLRRAAAKQLIQMDVGMSIWEGDNGSTIITHRNAKAMEVLKEQIDAGKRKVGIFYGAGHLKDMEQRLLKDFDMEPGQPKWQRAWKLEE